MAPSIDESFGRAMASFRTGNLGDAEQNFKDVLQQDPRDKAGLAAKALAYRQVLSLLIAERRPSGLLASDPVVNACQMHPIPHTGRPSGPDTSRATNSGQISS